MPKTKKQLLWCQKMSLKNKATALYLICFLLTGFLCLSCQPSPSADMHVYVLYPVGGKGDRSFADAAYEGLVRASLKADFTKTEAEPGSVEQAREIFNEWISVPAKAKELIILIGQTYDVIVEQAGCDFNGRQVLFLDMNLGECPDLQSVNYETFAPSFLAGVAAMALSATGKAAVVEGMAIETVNRFTRGFTAGVEYGGGEVIEVAVLSDNETGFDHVERAKQEAERLFQRCDVIFPVAGASSAGVIEAAKTVPGRYVVGVDTDQSYMGKKVVIGSVVKYLGQTVYDVVTKFSEGVFEQGRVSTGLEDGGTDFLVNDLFAGQVCEPVTRAYPAALEAEKRDKER